MKKSVAFGAIAILAFGIVAAHSLGIGIGPSQPATQAAPAAAKPMSPLQLMRRDRETIGQADDLQAAF